MKKFLAMALAAMMSLTAVSALADTVETTNEDGTVTVTTDAGVTFSYDKADFDVTIDESGNVVGKYIPETAEEVSFSVEMVKDTTAEAYLADATTEVTKEASFNEETEWMTTETEEVGEKNTVTVATYVRDCDGGCYVVKIHSFHENTVEAATATDEEPSDEANPGYIAVMELLVASMSFSK